MNVLLTLFQQYIEFSSNPYLIIPIQIVSFVILSRIIANFVSLRLSQKKFNYEKTLFIFFIIPIVAIMIDNVFLIVKFIIPKTPLCRSINCLAWIFSGIKFHSLILFLEQLIHKKISWNSYHKLFFALEFLMCCAFIMNTVRAILYNESYYFVITFYYIIVLFSFISIIITILKQLSNQNIPIVLKQQIKTLLIFFLCPHFICTLLELLPIVVFGKAQILAFLNIGIILITASIYFCFKKIMQFRFLNHSDHVQAQPKINITTNFKDAIEQINVACNEQELEYIAQQFFTEQFSIPKQQITLYVRSNHETQKELQQQIETFLTTEYPDFNPIEMLLKHKILVNHEIEFDEFYTDNQMIVTLSKFLRSIQCDIFLPIINNKKLLGYITVQTQPTPTLYNFDQQNKMMVFAKFLAPAMYMLQQQNTYTLLQETKEIKEELYEKQQEINQYKESIKQLLKDRVEHHIGIIFYKGKHFAFKNQEAQTLLTINPNLETDHPTTATLINFAQQIEKFQTTQNMYLPMHDGSKIMISGMPQPHNDGGVLLIVRKPEATDLIKMHIDALKNPSQRDYLLYLETTKVGQSINKLLPSNHETFLNIKIQLLQAALQKSALLLQMHHDDINTMVNIIHELSGAQTLQIIDLHPGHQVTAATIFGINPLLNQQQEQALLEKLVNGTLLIKNIEYADHITQQKLAHMMRYGIYTPVKSEQRKFSDTRVICSTSQNLDALHHEGIIVSDLYQELSRHHLALPSLVTMDSLHISELIDGFMYQNLQKPGSSHLRALNYKDKQALIDKHIASLFALQQKVYTLMSMKAHEAASKAQEKNIPAKTFDTTSPELKLAAQLGKHALKDIQLMKTLWKRLGNQTKIADLLGVNRSSVNRRCKEYNLI